MNVVSMQICIDCDRVVRSPGRCRTCQLAFDLARRSALAAEQERRKLAESELHEKP